MTALGKAPRHRSSPILTAAGKEKLRPRLPASPMADGPEPAGCRGWQAAPAPKPAQRGWNRRCSDSGGQTQLGHRVSPAPTILPARGSRHGTVPQTQSSPRRPNSITGKPRGCRATAAWQEREHNSSVGHYPGQPLAGSCALPAAIHTPLAAQTSLQVVRMTTYFFLLWATPSNISALSFHLRCKPD